jgi:hypothetical protein
MIIYCAKGLSCGEVLLPGSPWRQSISTQLMQLRQMNQLQWMPKHRVQWQQWKCQVRSRTYAVCLFFVLESLCIGSFV